MTWLKRLPVIRHIRYFWFIWRVHVHAARWASVGIGLGIPNQSDVDWLDRIWKGQS